MNIDVEKAGREAYLRGSGYYNVPKDKDGFIILQKKAVVVDHQAASLTTSIGDLESKLKDLRAQKAKITEYQKTDFYKESKKEEKQKKKKKERNALLEMVFNNNSNDVNTDDEDEDEENGSGYKETKKHGRPRKNPENTLETQYGKRYAPIVSMYFDNMRDFDKMAADIKEELENNKTRNMYRSTQISNLLSAMDKKASMVDKIARIADKVTDIEYKREKDKEKKQSEEGSDTKAIANLGSKYLRGVFDTEEEHKKGKGKKGKDKKKEKAESNFARQSKSMGYKYIDSDDDDDEDDVIRPSKSDYSADKDLAKALAQELMSRNDVSFSEHEKHLDLEGKFTPMVLCDPLNPDKDWKFVAVDKKGKILDGDIYKKLLPSKKAAKMRFSLEKARANDSASGRSYKLMFKD